MFSNCNYLTDINFDNFKTIKSIYIDDMLANCHSITSLDI